MKIIDKIGQLFGSKVKAKTTTNAYNEAFFEYIGETGTGYDTNAKSYIDHGYNVNSIVYSIVNQQARKSAKVPFYIKKVDDEQKAKQFLVEIKKENIGQPQVKLNAKALEKKAFSEVETMEMPIEKPNIFQSWPEFISLYKTFLKLTGNVYIYMMAPENGVNAGAPMAFYLLPSHLIDIVLKPGANLMIDDSPVDFYRLTEGAVYKDFNAENVVHIKYSNPNFDMNGSHLYGQSPLKSALKNIESANEALTQNIKTLKNSGAFGFIHGKQQPLNPDQAKELKDRLREMDASPERLSNIAGVSAEVGFTRLTLTTDELQPFAYLSYDEKQLCNVLGWSDKLLNNDAGAKYSNIQESRKQVVTDDIMPDLGLLEQAFNDVILPKYTKYANTMLYFDVSTLPEMQLDMASLTSWLTRALKDGVINRNEYREALNYPILEEEEMDVYTVSGKLNPLERALEEDEKPPMPGVPGLPAPKGKPNPKSEKKNLITSKAGFDPNQQRNEDGTWGSGGVNEMTDEEVEAEYQKQFGDVENKWENLPQSQLDFMEKIKNSPVEIIGVFCGENLVTENTGTESQVSYKDDLLGYCLDGTTTIHNHPSGNAISSVGDLWTFANSGDDRMIIVTSTNAVMLERTGDFRLMIMTEPDIARIGLFSYSKTVKKKLFHYHKDYQRAGYTSREGWDLAVKRLQNELIKHNIFNDNLDVYFR